MSTQISSSNFASVVSAEPYADLISVIQDRSQAVNAGHGVYELWQKDMNALCEQIVFEMFEPAQHEAALEALEKAGHYCEIGHPGPGECQHYLDVNTCPAGCFEDDDMIEDDFRFGITDRRKKR